MVVELMEDGTGKYLLIEACRLSHSRRNMYAGGAVRAMHRRGAGNGACVGEGGREGCREGAGEGNGEGARDAGVAGGRR
jgi:hypothetical protein